MRTNKRILAITTALAMTTLGVGLASADRGDRRAKKRSHQVEKQYRGAPGRRANRAERPRRTERPHRANRPSRHYTPPRRYDTPRRRVRRPRRVARHRAPVHRYVAPRPFYGAYMVSRADRILSRADLNHDGYISWREARWRPNLRRHFSHIDRNRDGFLSRRELRLHFH